ncbi:MAG: hypothetical protein ABW135_08080 [Thermoleophilaceae bacterium]
MNRLSRILVPVAAMATIALSIPTMANATDYCVQTSCGGTNLNDLQAALDEAKKSTDADRIFLGAGDYMAPSNFGFRYDSTGPVEIIGTGQNNTVLTAPLGATAVLNLNGGVGSSVHDLAIAIPKYSNGDGLYTRNAARRIYVGEAVEQSHGRDGVKLFSNGMLEDSEVRLARETNATAVELGPGGGTVRRSVVSAGTGVMSRYGDGTIESSLVTGLDFGVRALANVTTVRSSRIHLASTNGTGIRADTQSASTTVNADGVTVTAADVPDVVGVSATTALAPTQNARVKLTNSILRVGGKALSAESTDKGEATVAASYSDYDPGFNKSIGAAASISEANVSNLGDTGFVAPEYNNYRLLPTSELVDAGDPAAAQGVDLDGDPLVADGNGDGIARRDIGAFELQPAKSGGQPGGTGAADTVAPVIRGFSATRTVFTVARASTPLAARASDGTRLRYTLSERARVTVAIQRAVKRGGHVHFRTVGSLRRAGAQGANTIRFSGRIGKRALRPGRYRALIRATDAAGNRSQPRTVGLRIKRF